MSGASATGPCPGCSAPLELTADVSRCGSCRGAWLTEDGLRHRLELMKPGAVLAQRPGRGAGGRRCPACAEPLASIEIEGIELDRCAEHGVWFDANELSDLLVAVAGGAGEEPGNPLFSGIADLLKG